MPVAGFLPLENSWWCQASPLGDERLIAALGREQEGPPCHRRSPFRPGEGSEKAAGLGQTTTQPYATGLAGRIAGRYSNEQTRT